VVDRSTSAELEAAFAYAPLERRVWVDYIWVQKVSDSYPTPNPALPTLPAVATPPPMPTEVCRESTPPTPAPDQFSLTPTPAPYQFYDHETFNSGTGNWTRIAGTVGWVSSPSHSNSLDVGALQMQYSDDEANLGERDAAAFAFSPPITGPVYVQGFAHVDAQLLAGQTAWLEVWYLDDAATWQKDGQHMLGYNRWQPFHSELPSVTIQAVGLAVYRSDGNVTETVTVDDLTIYNNLNLRPLCSKYNNADGTDANAFPVQGRYNITYPADKVCPPDLADVPNNFWGPLLAGLTILTDNLFAFAPTYTPGRLPAIARAALAPFTVTFVLLLSFLRFDQFFVTQGIKLLGIGFFWVRDVWVWLIRSVKG